MSSLLQFAQSVRRFLIFPKGSPRLPVSAAEARLITARWLRLTGHHYFIADVVVEARLLLKYVAFDADTNVALSVGDQWIGDLPELFGRPITSLLRIRDASGISATYVERMAFARHWHAQR